MIATNYILHALILEGFIPQDDAQHNGYIGGNMSCAKGWVEAQIWWSNPQEMFRIRYLHKGFDLRHDDYVEFCVIRTTQEGFAPQAWVSFDFIERRIIHRTTIYRQEQV